ncbi:MAG: AraC family transcriptional regulator [Chloroflexota bacterium]
MEKNRSDRMHRHDFYELVWLKDGHCTFFADFLQFPLEEGSLIFISPGQLHDYLINKAVVRLYIIGFRPTLLPTVAHHLLNVLPFDDAQRDPTLIIPPALKPTFLQLFSAAHQRFDSQQLGWESIATAYLQTLLTEAAYLMPEDVIRQASSAAVQLTKAFQHEVEQHYRTLRQVQEYANILGVTSNHLVKTVREATMTTPKQMLQDRLLLEAKRLLVHTRYPINQISGLLAFPNSTTFARWFKKLAGTTPSDFRSRSILLM